MGMGRKLVMLVAALTFGLVTSVPLATAGPALPYNSHPHGHSYSQWLRMVGQFYLGDATNPLFGGLAGDCGELIDGTFFLAAPIDLGVVLDCDVPTGTPVVVSHAGWFTTEGIDGDTDAELEAAAVAGFVTTSDHLSLDGRSLSLRPIDTGAYDVVSEPGSFYDTILGVGTGPVRSALRANVVVLHPLSRGDHVLEGAVNFTSGEAYSVTYHLHVGSR
jgi:hypothetical protein